MFYRLDKINIELTPEGHALATLVQLGKAQKYESLQVKVIDIRADDNRVVFSFNAEALAELAENAIPHRSSSKYRWAKTSTYTLYEGETPIATLTEEENGSLYLDIESDQYTVQAWVDEFNYAKPRTVFSVDIEGDSITKPARHQLLEAAYRAYIGDTSIPEADDDQTEETDE